MKLAFPVSFAFALAIAAVVLGAASDAPAAPTANCKLLSEHRAAETTDEPEVLVSDYRAGNGEVYCRFDTGPAKPASVPPKGRVNTQLTLHLFHFTKDSLRGIEEDFCVFAKKGIVAEEACTLARKARKADSRIRSFQLLREAHEQLGEIDRGHGYGGPAFFVQLDPPFVGTELWIYLEDQRKLLVTTCLDLSTAGEPPHNGHFRSCVAAAAHGALAHIL